MTTRSYSELSTFNTFRDRFDYLSLRGTVGTTTFGFDRWINQGFYKSAEWRRLRHQIIARDNGCDLGAEGWEIYGRLLVHHMNPVSLKHFEEMDENYLINPENLITVSHDTHNAIHYGNASLLPKQHVPRTRGDTKLW